MDETVRTTCPYCGVGCGVLATPRDDGTVVIAGDPDHPANKGRLCSKGSALGETLSLDGRLLFPTRQGKRVSWDDALDEVASRFAATIAQASSDYFLRENSTLLNIAGSSRQFVDANVNSNVACPARPFTTLGTWSITTD